MSRQPNLEYATMENCTMRGGERRQPVVLPDAAAYTVAAKHSGRVHIVPDLTADITISLPAAAKGLNYEFWYGGADSDAQDWIIDTGADANCFKGGLTWLDEDAADAEVAAVYPNGSSNSVATLLTPDAGTVIKLLCDGTYWYLNGVLVSTSATAVAFADQA